MHFGKRELMALALIGSTLPMGAYAGDLYTPYPQRPITLVVGYSAGGGVDILARSLAKHMSENLEQRVIVENRPGAASNIAADSVARAEPDGYTLYISTHPNSPRTAAQADAASDPGNRLAPIGLLATVPNVIVAGPQTPITSIQDLVTLAKAHPQMLNFGSPGVGSPPHLLGELFLRKTKAAPAGTPAEVITRLNRSINAVLANPELQQAFTERGYAAPLGPNTPETFRAVVAAEARKWDTASPAST